MCNTCNEERNNRVNNTAPFEIYDITSFAGNKTDEIVLPAFYRDYTIIWIQKGSGHIHIDTGNFDIAGDTIYFTKPGQFVYFKITKPVKGFIISFAREFLDVHEKESADLINETFFNHLLKATVIRLNNEADCLMENIAGKIMKESKDSFEFKSTILKGFLKIFIIYTSRRLQNNYTRDIAPRKTELVKTFHMLLEKHFFTKRMVKEYAILLNVTAGYLNDIVGQVSGFTASYHIQQRIVLEAKRRVLFQGHSMKEVAYYLGFPDQAHFSKYFKNVSGKTFTEFKKATFNDS
jgi:AraC family transcriptional regulator, transcriptional activator of pobA